MVESRWSRRIGPGLIAVGATILVVATTHGARGRDWDPAPCVEGTVAATSTTGTWWRLDPVLEDARLTGQRLTVGAAGTTISRSMVLDAEAFAAGPFDGQVLVGTDDGSTSTLSLLDPARDCTLPVVSATTVVRRAIMTPDHRATIELHVDRTTRADRGILRRPLDGSGTPTRILPPLDVDDRFGPTWTTELAWSLDGTALAVQSCGAVACRTRIVDPAGRAVATVAALDQGDMIGLAEGRLIVHEACGGMPCPVVAVSIADGSTTVLEHDAWQAVLTVDATGRPTVIVGVGDDGSELESIGLDGAPPVALPADTAGRTLVPGPARAGSATELRPGTFALAASGRVTIGSGSVAIRGVPANRARSVQEVTR